MAEFGVKATSLQDPSGTMPVIEPVRQPAGPSVDLSGAAGWFTGIGKDSKEKPWMVMRNDYQKRLGGIEEARLTGQMDDRTARLATSKLTTEYQIKGADFGEEYSKSIANTYNQVRTGTGIEESEFVRRQELTQIQEFSKGLVDQGIIQKPISQMTEQEREATTNLYTSLKRTERVAKDAEDAYAKDVERKKNNFALDSAQHTFAQNRLQVEAQGALAEMKSSVFGVLHNNYKGFKEKVATGEMTLADAQQALKLNFGSVSSNATNLLQGDAASITDFNKNSEFMLQVYSDALDPTKQSKLLDDEIDRIIKTQQLFQLKNIKNVPELAALGKMLPNTDFGKFAATSAAMDALVGDLTNISTTKTIPSLAAGDTATQRETFKGISATMNQGVSGTSRDPKGDIDAAASGVDAVFKSMGKLDGSDKVSYAYVTDFLASDTLSQYIKQGKYNPELAAKAVDTYSQTVLNSFAQTSGKFLMSDVGQGTYTDGRKENLKAANMMSLIRLEVDDTGKVTAKMSKDPGAEFKMEEHLLKLTVLDAQKQANELSKFIRAGTHLSGSTDYKKFWEENAASFFPPQTMPTPDQRKELMSKGWDGVGFPFNKSSWTKKSGE